MTISNDRIVNAAKAIDPWAWEADAENLRIRFKRRNMSLRAALKALEANANYCAQIAPADPDPLLLLGEDEDF